LEESHAARGLKDARAGSRRGEHCGLETNSFRPTRREYSASEAVRLPVVTADTGKLIAAAIAGLAIIFKPGYRYK
jgi:DNA polymerase V